MPPVIPYSSNTSGSEWVLAVLLGISILIFARAVLISTGLLKAPFMQIWKRKREENSVALQYALAVAAALFAGGNLVLRVLRLPFQIESRDYQFGLGLSLVLGWLFIFSRLSPLRRLQVRLFQMMSKAYPAWYTYLMEQTSKDDRWLVAQAWYRLPARTRRIYSVNSHAFIVWLDLVLLTLS